MNPLDDASLFLVNTMFGLYVYALVARFLLQATRSDFYNPLAQFIWRITNPVSQPIQRYVPRWRSYDLATLLIAWILLTINILIDGALLKASIGLAAIYLAALKVAVMFLSFYTFAILILAVMSWFGAAMHSPAAGLLYSITNPLMRPIRSRLPAIAGLDLSPLIVIIVLQVISRLIPLPYILR